MRRFAHCPICIFRELIQKGTKASDYICPRHGVNCIQSGEATNLKWRG